MNQKFLMLYDEVEATAFGIKTSFQAITNVNIKFISNTIPHDPIIMGLGVTFGLYMTIGQIL